MNIKSENLLLLDKTKKKLLKEEQKIKKIKKKKKNEKNEFNVIGTITELDKKITRCSKTFFTQMKYRLWFEFLNFYRNPNILFTIIILFFLICSLIGFLFRDNELTFESAQNKVGLTVFLTLLLAFQSLFSIPTFFNEKKVYIYQIQLSLYYKSSYFYSKIIFEAFITKILPIFFLLPCYFIARMTISFSNIFCFLVIMICFNISLGLNNFIFCCIFQTPELTIVMMVIMHLFGMLTCGAFLNINSVPIQLRFIRFFSYWNYTFKALMYNEINDKYFFVPKGKIPGFSGKLPGSFLLNFFGVMPENFQNYIKFLILFVIVLFIFAKFSLKFFVSTKN